MKWSWKIRVIFLYHNKQSTLANFIASKVEAQSDQEQTYKLMKQIKGEKTKTIASDKH